MAIVIRHVRHTEAFVYIPNLTAKTSIQTSELEAIADTSTAVVPHKPVRKAIAPPSAAAAPMLQR